tara:strand:+ start:270 stop:557 length:288 start_codon:yes stop_codon:yes gene_type:complete
MNRQQRRARDRQIKKSKEKETDLEQKMGLFDLMPDDCFICHKSFDKKDKEMVTTWNVVVREKERSVKIYCPTCWNNAVSLLKQYGVPIKDEGQDQ